MRRLAFLLALSLSFGVALSACGPQDTDPTPDATPELPDPDPDGPLDVDPLSRDDGQTSDDTFDEMETGDDTQDFPVEDPDPPVDEPNE